MKISGLTENIAAVLLATMVTCWSIAAPNTQAAEGQADSAPAASPLVQRISSALSAAEIEAPENIRVTGINGIVLLTGQVSSPQDKLTASNTAAFAGRSDLIRLSNELRVVDSVDTGIKAQDARLTESAARLLASGNAELAEQLAVIVENGRLYMVGQISQAQAQEAAGYVNRLEGLNSMRAVFEYMD